MENQKNFPPVKHADGINVRHEGNFHSPSGMDQRRLIDPEETKNLRELANRVIARDNQEESRVRENLQSLPDIAGPDDLTQFDMPESPRSANPKQKPPSKDNVGVFFLSPEERSKREELLRQTIETEKKQKKVPRFDWLKKLFGKD